MGIFLVLCRKNPSNIAILDISLFLSVKQDLKKNAEVSVKCPACQRVYCNLAVLKRHIGTIHKHEMTEKLQEILCSDLNLEELELEESKTEIIIDSMGPVKIQNG